VDDTADVEAQMNLFQHIKASRAQRIAQSNRAYQIAQQYRMQMARAHGFKNPWLYECYRDGADVGEMIGGLLAGCFMIFFIMLFYGLIIFGIMMLFAKLIH
jgi:predicted lipid-binding transport protein (Tim44 family)